jgi:hypothetical protein
MTTSTDVKSELNVPSNCKDIYYKFDGVDGASDKDFMRTPLAVN